jgi:SAM-dependent methyltransferase
MQTETIQKLLELNRQFYRDFAAAFAATRRRIQPGVRRILNMLPSGGNWLDLGCGSGALAIEWIRCGRSGSYTGLDFSAELLQEAQNSLEGLATPGLRIRFIQADLTDSNWMRLLSPPDHWDGVLAFAVFHHIPSSALRRKILNQVHTLLKPGGCLIHSEWQFHHSPRLLKRVLPWQTIGLVSSDLEEGDYLLDWRYNLPGHPAKRGFRYIHLFSRQELAGLANECGLQIIEEFESDGEGGKLGLYQIWQSSS